MSTQPEIIRYKTALEYLAGSEGFLEGNELSNNLLIGISRNLQQGPPNAGHYFLSVVKNGKILVSAIKAGPKLLLSASTAPNEALTVLANFINAEKIPLAGLIAEADTVLRFMTMLGRELGRTNVVLTHELRKLKPGTGRAPGFRLAKTSEFDVLLNYLCDYELEVHSFPKRNRAELSDYLNLLLQKKALFVLTAGEMLLSMAAFVRSTRNIGIIGYVYTPQHFRKKGHAGVCVTELCRYIFEQGYSTCGLFTDQANETSNKIYREIGFVSGSPLSDIEFLPQRF